MKLLFDQNLPQRFVTIFADLFPGSLHVKTAELSSASDRAIWEFARDKGLAIISKDADFHQMSFLHGAPPKTIWVRSGNRSVAELAAIVRNNYPEIRRFLSDEESALLVIGQPRNTF